MFEETFPSDITLEIYSSMKDFENTIIQNQQIVDSELQTPIDSLLMEDQDTKTSLTAKE